MYIITDVPSMRAELLNQRSVCLWCSVKYFVKHCLSLFRFDHYNVCHSSIDV